MRGWSARTRVILLAVALTVAAAPMEQGYVPCVVRKK